MESIPIVGKTDKLNISYKTEWQGLSDVLEEIQVSSWTYQRAGQIKASLTGENDILAETERSKGT